MQDDNLQHMECMLTQAAYDEWVRNLTDDKLEYLYEIFDIISLEELYLKEHGLPIDSLIKDL